MDETSAMHSQLREICSKIHFFWFLLIKNFICSLIVFKVTFQNAFSSLSLSKKMLLHINLIVFKNNFRKQLHFNENNQLKTNSN